MNDGRDNLRTIFHTLTNRAADKPHSDKFYRRPAQLNHLRQIFAYEENKFER